MALGLVTEELIAEANDYVPQAPKTVEGTGLPSTSLMPLLLKFIYVEQRETPAEFMDALKRHNVGTGIHFRAAHQHSYYRRTHTLSRDLPHIDWNSDRVYSLPLFPDMEVGDVDRVVRAIRAVLSGG